MASAAEIGDVGASTLTSYFKAAKSQREIAVKGLDLEFQNFLGTNLIDNTYTKSDVEEIFNNYLNILKVALNKQFSDYVLNTVDIGLDVLEQVDGKEARLDIDVARFTGAQYEKEMVTLESDLTGKGNIKVLPSVTTKGADPHKKLIEATTEGARLKAKANSIQQQFTSMMREKTQVQNDLNKELDILRSVKEMGASPSDTTVTRLKEEVDKLLKDTALAEEEAKGSINSSTQFQNLKTIIQRKNEEIKSLRERLAQFETVKNDDDDDDA